MDWIPRFAPVKTVKEEWKWPLKCQEYKQCQTIGDVDMFSSEWTHYTQEWAFTHLQTEVPTSLAVDSRFALLRTRRHCTREPREKHFTYPLFVRRSAPWTQQNKKKTKGEHYINPLFVRRSTHCTQQNKSVRTKWEPKGKHFTKPLFVRRSTHCTQQIKSVQNKWKPKGKHYTNPLFVRRRTHCTHQNKSVKIWEPKGNHYTNPFFVRWSTHFTKWNKSVQRAWEPWESFCSITIRALDI